MMEPVYDVDGIQIWHADCADVLPTIDPATVGLLLTDPPYGISLDTNYDNGRLHDTGYTYLAVAGDDTSFDPDHLFLFRRCVLFGANNFIASLPRNGSWIVWDKVTRDGVATRGSDGELAWCDGVSAEGMVFVFRHMWKGAFRDTERGLRVHPTQKPVALMRWIVDKWTEPGDLILDPYMGSGPIARACADLGRRYIGIELVEEYVQAAINRLGQTTLDLNQ